MVFNRVIALLSLCLSFYVLFELRAGNKFDVEVSDSEILGLQIKDISRTINHLFARQVEFPEEILPSLNPLGGLNYTGFIPFVRSNSDAQKLANVKHRLAMSKLTFADNGSTLISSVAGRILIKGHGNHYIIDMPDCPVDICMGRTIKINR